MPTISCPSADVSYRAQGEGDLMVLVHGTGGTAESNWGNIAPRLAESYRVVTPDYAGSGETRDHGGSIELAELADQVYTAATAEGDGPLHLVGFSLGAVVAAATALEHPDRVRSLVLIAGWVQSDARTRVQFELWEHLVRNDPEAAAKLIVLTGFSADFLSTHSYSDLVAMLRDTTAGFPLGMARQANLDGRIDLTERLPNLRVPTLVVGLTQDQMVPIRYPRILAEMIPGAEFAEMDSGHLVLFERPDEVIDTITKFAGRH